jgi:hypothetical protein
MVSTLRFDKWENEAGTQSVGIDQISGGSGLVPLVPLSVSVSSGSASFSENGLVTFTSARDINLAGIFTSLYRNYLFVLNGIPSGTSEIGAWFTNSGTNISSGWYGATWFVAFAGNSGTNGLRNNGNGGWIGNSQNSTYAINSVADIYIEQSPARAQYHFSSHSRAYGANYNGGYGVDGACDGFRVSPLSAGVTMTGTIRVYGYR